MATESKENTLKLLEEYYRSAKEQVDAWNFFLNTADYVKFIQNNNQLSDAVKRLEEQHRQAYEVFKKADDVAIKELQKASKTLTSIVEKLNIDLEPVTNAVKELKMYNEGHILSSMTQAHRLNAYLFDIARSLKMSGFVDAVKQFYDQQDRMRGEFSFSSALFMRDRLEDELNAKRETELWGAWRDFPFIKRVVFDGVNLTEELVRSENQNEKMKKWALMNFIGVRTEAGVMEARKKSDSELVFFKVDDFRKKLDRVHKYLLTELLSEEETETANESGFSYESTILRYQGKEITVSKTKNSRPYFLLKTILKNPKAVWNYDELWQDLFSTDYEAKEWKQIYNAAYDLNEKIATKAGISDFLEISKTTVRISPKYL